MVRGDLVAEPFKLGDGSAAAMVGVVAVEEVVAAEVLVGGSGGQDVPGRTSRQCATAVWRAWLRGGRRRGGTGRWLGADFWNPTGCGGSVSSVGCAVRVASAWVAPRCSTLVRGTPPMLNRSRGGRVAGGR